MAADDDDALRRIAELDHAVGALQVAADRDDVTAVDAFATRADAIITELWAKYPHDDFVTEMCDHQVDLTCDALAEMQERLMAALEAAFTAIKHHYRRGEVEEGAAAAARVQAIAFQLQELW